MTQQLLHPEEGDAGLDKVAPPKTSHSRRFVPIGEVAAAALRRHRHLIGPWVFSRPDGSRFTHTMAANGMKKVARASGLRPLRLHDLRHTYVGHRLHMTPEQTERIAETVARIGQDRFARAVLHNYTHRCGFCGLDGARLPGTGILRASHIKPWRDSSPRERTDPRNGIAACPIHDTAFDSGLLTVNGGLLIHRATALRRSLGLDPAAQALFGEKTLMARLRVPCGGLEPRRHYLDFHRHHIFRNGAAASA